MDQEQSKMLAEALSSFAMKLEALEKRLDVKNPPAPPVQLTIDDFRGKKRVPDSKRKKTRTGLVSIYASIDDTEVKYFEGVLNRVLELTGFKLRISDMLRGIINDFMNRYPVETASEFMNKGKSKFIVR